MLLTIVIKDYNEVFSCAYDLENHILEAEATTTLLMLQKLSMRKEQRQFMLPNNTSSPPDDEGNDLSTEHEVVDAFLAKWNETIKTMTNFEPE